MNSFFDPLAGRFGATVIYNGGTVDREDTDPGSFESIVWTFF